MTKESLDFFRKEALRRRGDSLHGTVRIQVPTGWITTGIASALAAIVLAVVLWIASFSSVITVDGVLRNGSGVVRVKAARSGTLVALYVHDGDAVTQGQIIGRVIAQPPGFGGASSDTLTKSMDLQSQQLSTELSVAQQSLSVALDAYNARVKALNAEIRSAEEREAMQSAMVEVSKRDLENVKLIAQRGFLSQRDLNAREEKLAVQQQMLAQIRGEKRSKLAMIDEARSAYAAETGRVSASIARLRSQQSGMDRQRLSSDLEKGYSLSAPASGVIENLAARVGDTVSGGQQVFSISGARGGVFAEFHLNERLASSVRVGDKVKVSFEAFPAQKYGYLEARVSKVFGSPLVDSARVGGPPIYVAYARIDSMEGSSLPEGAQLLEGMRLKAHFSEGNPSVFSKLFSALIASN